MGRDDEVAQARSLKMKRAAMVNPLVGEIIDILMECGGSAHRNVVIERLAQNRGVHTASDAFRGEVIQAVDVHIDGAALRGEQPLVRLAFGPGSHRWIVTSEAETGFRRTLQQRSE